MCEYRIMNAHTHFGKLVTISTLTLTHFFCSLYFFGWTMEITNLRHGKGRRKKQTKGKNVYRRKREREKHTRTEISKTALNAKQTVFHPLIHLSSSWTTLWIHTFMDNCWWNGSRSIYLARILLPEYIYIYIYRFVRLKR